MHEELTTPERAVVRLMKDTLIHLVRQSGPLRFVRVALPEAWDAAGFAGALSEAYAERGHDGVEVMVVPTTGEPRLLSVICG